MCVGVRLPCKSASTDSAEDLLSAAILVSAVFECECVGCSVCLSRFMYSVVGERIQNLRLHMDVSTSLENLSAIRQFISFF